PRYFASFATVPPAPARPSHTVPTGFSGVPPSGPAMPVIDAAQVAPDLRRAPSAIARTTGSLTAPCCWRRSRGTPRALCFISFEYVTKPPAIHFELPATSVSSWDKRPPVQLSAQQIVSPLRASSSPTACAKVTPACP